MRASVVTRLGSVDAASTERSRVVAGPAAFDYEQIPDGYYDVVFRRGRGVQSKWHHLKFDRVLAEMEGYPRHLDVGCGPGTLIGLLDDRFVSTGIDVSAGQIAYARRAYGSGSKRFLALHPRALPEECREYDVATAVEVLEHLSPPEVDDVIGATVARLRHGGKLIVTTPNYHSAWPLVQMLVNRLGAIDYTPQHVNKFTAPRLCQLLRGAGLTDVHVCRFLALAPFTAPFGWRRPDAIARLERRRVEPLAGLLLLGTAIRP